MESIGVMDPGWCSEMTGKIRKVDEECKFDQFFSGKLLEPQEDVVAADKIQANRNVIIAVMDPEWCSEMTRKIRQLDENCKYEEFFKPDDESLTTPQVEESISSLKYKPLNSVSQLWESQTDIVEETRITTLAISHSYALGNFRYFKSTNGASEKLKVALKDERSCIIGLYGKKGSGKTALVTADKVEYPNTFDQVLFVTPRSDPQDQIISQLNLRFPENMLNFEKSYQIKSILKSKKKILAVFDDVATEFDPHSIGIPAPSKQCKVLWIARDKTTLNLRGCDQSIYLHPLSGDDSWNLLKQYSGIDDDGSSNEELVNVAREVSYLCKGLPRQIKDVVSFLQNKNTDGDDGKLKQYWEESLDCLKHETARYEIFISFRGTDTRDHFTEFLYDALHQAGFKVFIDKEIRSGDRVSETLINVIEQSRASIVVLSENYAQSSWCLDELLKIMECEKKIKQLIYPIYFKVEPSHVRHLLGTYEVAMTKKKERYEEVKIQEWTSALHEIAGFSGNHFKGESCNAFIKEIVEYVKGNKHRLHVL